ncbi:MAG: hypothetical protein P8Y30_01980, partial [candidate division WOR-3 bacterium]
MNKKRKICVISFSNLRNDPRVRRQILTLKDKYDITTLGLEKSEIEGVNEFILPDSRTFIGRIDSRLTFLLARLFNSLYKRYIQKKYPTKEIIDILGDSYFDLMVANELAALVIAVFLANRTRTKILFDAHEYEPKQFEDRWFDRLFINPYKDFLCKQYLPLTDVMTTSSCGFAKEYYNNYGIESEIIMNVPQYEKISLKKPDPNNIKLIHHGIAHPSRKLEKMIQIMPLLEKRFNLTFMLAGENRYLKYLKNASRKMCPERTNFRSPVPFEKIVPTIAKYDIGLVIIEPTSLKLRYALPNKLFESIMAGLCIITGP